MQPYYMRNRFRPSPLAFKRFAGPSYGGLERRPFPGGIISRLFGQQGPSRPMAAHPFSFSPRTVPPQTGNFLQNILNPERLTHFLGQTQQVLQTGQQMINMYQQYGPLIRNLPALWKMYRSMKQTEEGSEEVTEEIEQEQEEEEIQEEELPDRKIEEFSGDRSIQGDDSVENKKEEPVPKKRKKKVKYTYKESIPKLYI